LLELLWLSNRPEINADRATRSTIADLAFITWNEKIPSMFETNEIDVAKDYPHYLAWHNRLLERPAVAKTLKDKEAAMIDFMAKMAAIGPPKPQQVPKDKTEQIKVTAVEAIQG
jgi:glutathione S-transferase